MKRARLSRRRRWTIYAVGFGLWTSGALWLVAHYLWTRQGEFGPETSPVEPVALDVHGGFAMGTLLIVGLLWGVHVVMGWRAREARWSGAVLLGTLAVLALTGYFLYYLGDEGWRGLTSIAHWALGLALLPAFLWHRLQDKGAGRRTAPRAQVGGERRR